MKRKLLLACIALMPLAAHAQPTIQANEFDYATAPLFWLETASFNVPPGASGANVSWNFSSIQAPSSMIYSTHACPGYVNCGTFPGANQAVEGNGTKVYFNKTSTEMSQVGDYSADPLVYSNPMKMLQFPISYGQIFTDAFACAAPLGGKTGSVTSTIDAYGTIKTPNGTYTNVLRQKIVETSVVSTGTQTYNMVITQYYWLKPGIHHYVMSIIITEISGLPTTVPPAYVLAFTNHPGDEVPNPVGITEQEILSGRVNVYPNPTTDMVNIKSSGLAVNNVCVYNLIGQKLLDQHVESNSNECSVSLQKLQLSAGCYFLKINTEKGLVTKQVTIR